MSKYNKRLLPRIARRRYWLEAWHPDIGWHSWQKGPVLEGGWLIRLHFFPVKSRQPLAYTGWDCDRHRFICERRRHPQVRLRAGWRYAYYFRTGEPLGTLKLKRFANPDTRLSRLYRCG